MTQVLERQIRPAASPIQSRRGEMLSEVFRVLNVARVRWAAPHGHEGLPNDVTSDVDLIVDGSALPGKLARLLEDNSEAIGGEIVQWLADGAHYIVLADRSGPTPVLLRRRIGFSIPATSCSPLVSAMSGYGSCQSTWNSVAFSAIALLKDRSMITVLGGCRLCITSRLWRASGRCRDSSNQQMLWRSAWRRSGATGLTCEKRCRHCAVKCSSGCGGAIGSGC